MKKAYITLITNEKYLPGVLVLARSLTNTKTKIPFYVLLPRLVDSMLAAELKNHGIKVIFFEQMGETEIKGSGYWKDTLAKLKVFSLVEFDKVVFIDADMIVRKNLDFLFEYPHMSAVSAGKELHPDWQLLNSGLMVVKPNHRDYLGLIDTIEKAYQDRIQQNLPFGDQDVINYYFKDWPVQQELHLPSVLNVMLGYGGILKQKRIIEDVSEIAIYHFTGKQKPWGSVKDIWIILLKIMKRSPYRNVDLEIYREYRRLLKK